MSKAEERALEAIPLKIEGDSRGSYDLNVDKRIVYQLGYEQAEKDLELTWEDIRKIVIIYENVLNDKDFNTLPIKDGYTEVLKRYKNLKK